MNTKTLFVGAVLTLLLVTLTASAANFPTAKNNWILDGSASIVRSDGDLYDGITTITFNPFVAKFFSNGLAFGGSFLFENMSADGASGTTFGLGPTVIYYFKYRENTDGKGLTIPFINFAFQYINLSGDFAEGSGTTLHFGGGATHMVSNSVGISGEGFFEHDSVNPDGPGDSISGGQFGVQFGFTIFLLK